ncbi:MAG TPA: hypothetical protein PLP05_08120 [Sedimentisphaerales bacterium]|nr:hypothetical protein [Sedimentisphaerales bacterium]
MKNIVSEFRLLAFFSLILLFFIFSCCSAFEGDITGDGYVDFADLSVMASKWLVSGCDINDCSGADINISNNVDMKDFSLLAGKWNSLDPSLIGWWKFDALFADQAIDSTGNGNSGIFQGNARTAASEMGGALELDGDGDYIAVSNESNFDITKTITLAAWVRATQFKDGMMVVSKGDSFCFYRDYEFNRLVFYCDGVKPLIGNMNVFDFQWHHVAAVYDGVSESIYVDGTLDKTRTASGSIKPNNEKVWIGNASMLTDAAWSGEIDDVRIYSRALSQEELLNICRPYHLEARDMVPYDGTDYEPNNTTLSWTPGLLATSYDLYFGTDANEVENADHGSDSYVGNFPADSNTYDPGILDDGVSYYWRVEPVE